MPPPLPPRSPPKRVVSGRGCGIPRAQLVSFLFHHHTSLSLRLLPGHTRVKDTPLKFRLLSASPPGPPKHSGTCASSFPYSSSALFVLCPASCRTTSVGVLLSIPDIILAALSWVRSSLSLLVLEIQGPMPALHTPATFPRSQCRRDALLPRPAQIRTSQPHKEVVSGSLSPHDAELLVVGATQEL